MSNAQIKLIGQTDDPDTQEYAQKVSGMTRIKWEPPRAMPSVLRGGKAEPRRIESIRRPRLLADYFADMGWGTFFARSRTPLRTRETVEMPKLRRLPGPADPRRLLRLGDAWCAQDGHSRSDSPYHSRGPRVAGLRVDTRVAAKEGGRGRASSSGKPCES